MKTFAKKLTLTTLFLGLVSFSTTSHSANNDKDIQKVESYLNSIKTLQANFVQIASNGEKVEGKIFIEKPNKIRMEYNSPSDILIVGNGDYIVYFDKELDQITNIDYEDIPAALILANTVKIDGKDLSVTDFYHDSGVTKVGLEYNKDELGPFTLVFSNRPFELKQWKVITPQSMEVSLSLYDTITDSKLDSSLFEFRKNEESKKSRSSRRK